ncbi:MAG: RecX family transcriptional regulator [Patescibacteria group bacterium]
MPIITSIKAQKNLPRRQAGQKRVNIFLDGEFSFGLDLENFMKLGLKVNQELTEEEKNEIIKKGELQKCFDKTLRFVMTRPRSLKEVKDYFRRKEVDISLHQNILDRLTKLELLDDQKFAKWWVEQRLEFKSKSKKDITYELRQKGVDSNTIKNVLDDSGIDEIKIANDLIAKKSYKWQKYEDKVRKQKITQYLAGKGFDWNIINDVLK